MKKKIIKTAKPISQSIAQFITSLSHPGLTSSIAKMTTVKYYTAIFFFVFLFTSCGNKYDMSLRYKGSRLCEKMYGDIKKIKEYTSNDKYSSDTALYVFNRKEASARSTTAGILHFVEYFDKKGNKFKTELYDRNGSLKETILKSYQYFNFPLVEKKIDKDGKEIIVGKVGMDAQKKKLTYFYLSDTAHRHVTEYFFDKDTLLIKELAFTDHVKTLERQYTYDKHKNITGQKEYIFSEGKRELFKRDEYSYNYDDRNNWTERKQQTLSPEGDKITIRTIHQITYFDE